MNIDKSGYQEKTPYYFTHVRHDILPLLPANAGRIFEVGCGFGVTLLMLKSAGKCEWTGGIELSHAAAEIAREGVDVVLEGNIESMELPFEDNSMDVVLCLDVLEHLIDPWAVIHRLNVLLKPGGMLICSIPNIRNYRAVLPLLLFGKFEYEKDGILDRTHLRFFTKKSAIQLVECSGLTVDMVRSTGLEKWNRKSIVNLLTFSIFKQLFEIQYLIRAVKSRT